MNKPDMLPMLPGQPAQNNQAAVAPKALIQQPVPMNTASSQPIIPPTHPAHYQDELAYVDPYLFETGYYASRAEQAELTRTAATRIQLRADAENAQPRRRKL